MPEALNYRVGPHPGCSFKRLMHRTTVGIQSAPLRPDLPIYRIGPQPGGALYVPDVPNYREGPQAGKPSKCLTGGVMEKDWPKKSSDPQLQEAQK